MLSSSREYRRRRRRRRPAVADAPSDFGAPSVVELRPGMKSVGREQVAVRLAWAGRERERHVLAARSRARPARERAVEPPRACAEVPAQWLREDREPVHWWQRGEEDLARTG